MSTIAPEPAPPTTGHPPGLYALFTAEMWERVSYYGNRALLVLYLTKALGYDRPSALDIYAIYTGLVYLTPLIGGRLADRYLGPRKAVFIGGILMALGQFAMTQPALLAVGLGLLIVGNGFFKPNISTMVGGLYPQGDHRRDGAYTIFYMGINLGAFIAPLICGTLGEKVGWGYGYASAGVGMILGVMTFVFTQKLLKGVGMPPGREAGPDAVLGAKDWVQIALYAAIGVGAVYGAIQAWPTIRPLWSPSFLGSGALSALYKGAVLIGLLTFFLFLTEPRKKAATALDEKLTGEDWQRIIVILIISAFSIVFWAGFEQSGGTLNLFADQETDRRVFGWDVPASILQAVNPMFIILLAPVFAVLWTNLAKRNFPLPSFAKQGLGLLLLSVGFGVMYLADERSKVSVALPGLIDAATKATAGEAGQVELIVKEGSKDQDRTVAQAIADASKEAGDGRIPFNHLKDARAALDAAGSTKAATVVGEALGEAVAGQVSPLWLILVYFLFTVAELFVSPIGLSLVNKLAPLRLASLMMAVWFLCTAAANFLAGIMEKLVEPYHLNLWAFLGGLALVPGLLLLAITPLLVKMSHGKG